MSKKVITMTVETKMYVVARYSEWDDKFAFAMQQYEPSAGGSILIGTASCNFTVNTTREELVAKQLGSYDEKEAELRKEFNEHMLEVKEARERLLAIGYDGPGANEPAETRKDPEEV